MAAFRVDQMGTIDQLRTINTIFDVTIAFLLSMALLLGVVGGLGLMGTMSINVMERTRRSGVMRHRRLQQLRAAHRLVEGLIIGLISWAIGGLITCLPAASLL